MPPSRRARDAKAGKAAPRARMAAAESVDAYLEALPDDQRGALERLRKQVRAAAPKATEKISYGMPTFVHEGHLVYMAAFKEHCTFFPGRSGVTLALREKLKGHETTKGGIHFTPRKPIPAALVKQIVKLRVAENEARAAARKKKAAAKKRAARRS